MRVLSIGADRSKRGILSFNSPAFVRQRAYAEKLGQLDIIGYSLRDDGFEEAVDGPLHTYPTRAPLKLLYGTYAFLIARRLQKPDVVSTQDPHDTGLLGLWIARARRVPLHVQVHSDVFSPAYARHSLLNFARSRIARFVLKRADGIRAVSEGVKTSIEKYVKPRANISVLPIFVDTARFRDATPGEDLVSKFSMFKTKLLFVGRLEAEKNPGVAIELFAKSAPPESCLIFVGSGSLRETLQKETRLLGVFERVFFEGECDSAPYYKIADLVLVTSEYEGYGMVIVEALAAGTPVLSTDVGIVREAGAVVTSEKEFPRALSEWITGGARTGSLRNYPYANFKEYVDAYCADIRILAEEV